MLYYNPLQLNRLYTSTEYSHKNTWLTLIFKMLPDEQKSKAASQHVLILRVTDLNWLLAGTYTATCGHQKDIKI